MLEALIRTKISGGLDKRRGDVICVKLKEFADWGSMELRVHQKVDWLDEDLELSMRQEYEKTGMAPVRITPYQQQEDVVFNSGSVEDNLATEKVTKTRSKKYFDIDAIPDYDLKEKIIGDYAIAEIENPFDYIKEKTEEQVEEEFSANKSKIDDEIQKTKPGAELSKAMKKKSKLVLYAALNKYRRKLFNYGIDTKIVDGKIVRTDDGTEIDTKKLENL